MTLTTVLDELHHQDQLVGIRRDRKVTVLFVTHDTDEAVYMADRVIAIGGRPGEVRSI